MLLEKRSKVKKIVHAQKQSSLTTFTMLNKITHLVANTQVNQFWIKKCLKKVWSISMQEISLRTKLLTKVNLKMVMCQNRYFKMNMNPSKKMQIFKIIMETQKLNRIISVVIMLLAITMKKKQEIFRHKMEINRWKYKTRTYWVMKET